MVKVLFVCMGNICRSPSAEGVFLSVLRREGLDGQVEVDSAGTHGYHIGEPADRRSAKAALSRGVDISPHRARQVSIEDYEYYDYILAMNRDNYDRMKAKCPGTLCHKLRLFMEFAPHMNSEEVPDPYYGGPDGFERVLDLVEAASEGLLADIRRTHLNPQ